VTEEAEEAPEVELEEDEVESEEDEVEAKDVVEAKEKEDSEEDLEEEVQKMVNLHLLHLEEEEVEDQDQDVVLMRKEKRRKILVLLQRQHSLLPIFHSAWMTMDLLKFSKTIVLHSNQLMLLRNELEEAKDLALLSLRMKMINKKPWLESITNLLMEESLLLRLL